MPNHCSNSLHLDGDFKHRQEFVDKNKGFDWADAEQRGTYSDLSFHAQVPMPQKHIKSHAKDRTNSDWFSWANKNWGTKWSPYDESVDHSNTYTHYSFDTAWSPPMEWFKKVSRKFPYLKFNVTWAEEGGCGGRFMFYQGELCFEVSMTDEEWREYNGYEEDEEF